MSDIFSKDVFCSELKVKSSTEKERDVFVFSSIDSTSTELLRTINQQIKRKTNKNTHENTCKKTNINSCIDSCIGTVVVADNQTKGRGRQGNVWYSPKCGNLYISLAVSVTGDISVNLPLIPLAAGVAAVDALKLSGNYDVSCKNVSLKWPNDLLIGKKKLGGILCEAPYVSKNKAIAVVGFGLNLGQFEFPNEIANIAVSFGQFFNAKIEKENYAATWVVFLEKWIWDISNNNTSGKVTATLVDTWRKYADTFGRKARVGDIEGVTVDLNKYGRLLIKTSNGNIVDVPGGIVEYL